MRDGKRCFFLLIFGWFFSFEIFKKDVVLRCFSYSWYSSNAWRKKAFFFCLFLGDFFHFFLPSFRLLQTEHVTTTEEKKLPSCGVYVPIILLHFVCAFVNYAVRIRNKPERRYRESHVRLRWANKNKDKKPGNKPATGAASALKYFVFADIDLFSLLKINLFDQ